MGASTSVVVALFFLGFLVAGTAAYSAVDYYKNLVKNAQHDQDTMNKAKMQTDIMITNISFSNNYLNITLKNTGKTTLDASLLNIFVNGMYYGSSYCISRGGTWVPKNSTNITVYPLSITIDNSTSTSIGDASSMTWSHTVGSGLSNSLLVVGVDISKGVIAQVTSITYTGVNLTRAAFSVGGQNMRAEIWYLKNPTAGANNIVVTFNKTLSPGGAVSGAVSFSGIDQTNPIPTTATGGNDPGSPSTSIITANDNSWIIDTIAMNSDSHPSATSPQTERWDMAPNGMTGAGSTKTTTTAGSYTMSWSSSSAAWAQVVAEIKPFGCIAPTGGRIKIVTENGISDYALVP